MAKDLRDLFWLQQLLPISMAHVGVALQAVPARGCALALALRLSSTCLHDLPFSVQAHFYRREKYLNPLPAHMPGCATHSHFSAAPARLVRLV